MTNLARLKPAWVILAVALAWSPGISVAAPQVLRVTGVNLQSVPVPGGDRSRARLDAMLDDSASGGAYLAALRGNVAQIRIRDANGFDVVVPVTGCAQVDTVIRCDGAGTRARATRIGAGASYRLRLSTRRLDGASTAPLRPPLHVTLIAPGSAEQVDVISDCTALSRGRVRCRDRDRPNIVFVVSDDQRADTLQYMPRTLERLAAHGVTFTNAIVTTPLCAPSRASMLTGRYARHHGVLTNAGEHGGAELFVGPDGSTLATWLHDNGYRTGMYGKYLTDYVRQCPPFTAGCYIPPGWDEWHVFVQQRYYGYSLAENDGVVAYGSAPADYSTDVIAAKAVDFIATAQGQPFFLHVGFHAPHQEGNNAPIPAPRHVDSYLGLAPWLPPSYDEEDVSDKPPWLALQPRADDIRGGFVTNGLWTTLVRRHQIETLTAVDEAIEAMVQALEASGQADNTVFAFTSDNGYQWGEHRYFLSKSVPYEESIRVPLVVRFPRMTDAARSELRMALSIDLAPTLAELAGVIPPQPVDGVSFVPLIQNQPTTPRADGVIEFWSVNTQVELAWAGLRTPEWTYVPYANAGAGEVELYDLANDPYQLVNRAHDAAYQQTVTTLQTRLDALLVQVESREP